jgi:HAD superfamily hydrolase (TIGR01484 family)
MYKAVFLDMDGTLLRSDHSVSEATIQTIRTLTGRGIPVILVSARPVNAVLPTFHEIGIPESYPIITLNGSYIVEEDQPIFDVRIDLDTVVGVAEQVRPFSGSGTPRSMMRGRITSKRSWM